MDSFEMTKIAGAVLSALLLMFGFKTIVEMRASKHGETTAGYALGAAQPAEPATAAATGKPAEKAADDKPADAAKPTEKAEAGPAAPKAAESAAPVAAVAPAAGGGDDIAPLLAKASAENGKTTFSKCKSCHVVEQGKTSTVGPNLWGVVNRAKGSYEGYPYSAAMKGMGGNWTFADISAFLANPRANVAGTKMAFAGLEAPSDRADVIAYLATLADTPVPLTK